MNDFIWGNDPIWGKKDPFWNTNDFIWGTKEFILSKFNEFLKSYSDESWIYFKKIGHNHKATECNTGSARELSGKFVRRNQFISKMLVNVFKKKMYIKNSIKLILTDIKR